MKKLINQLRYIQEELKKAIDQFPEEKRNERMFDKWTLRDILAHMNYWYVHDLNCLADLKRGKEPYWAPDIDEYNKEGVESRKDKTWDDIYREFINLGSRLIVEYESLPSGLWRAKLWKSRKFTPKRFIEIDLEHLGLEHLPEILHETPVDQDWVSPKTEIRESKLEGKGLFAKRPIVKGELVVVWRGTYTNKAGADEAKKRGKLVMQWDDNLYSVEERGEGIGYYINHSCDSNLWMYGTYSLVAKRNIDRDEELTADYALWEADEDYLSRWECNCGSRSCRKQITGKDWKLRELQKRYKGHFSPLINERIRKLGRN